MIKWAPYIFVRLTLYLVVGILLGINLTISREVYLLCAYTLFCLIIFYWILKILVVTIWKGRLFQTLFGLLACGSIVLLGVLLVYQKTASNLPNHILHNQSAFQFYTATIVSEIQERAKNYKAEVEIVQVYRQGQWQKASGKILVYLTKQDTIPNYGDKIFIKGMPQPISLPANPAEFNYQKYLKNQQIYLQQFIRRQDFAIFGYQPSNPFLAFSIPIRQYADGVFKKLISSPREYAIATGLVLGIRSGFDNEIKQAYASAGAMHVLAVSGAHVVIVFQILALALGKLKNLKYGNWIFAFVILLFLWFYAFVTGLSASVLRAVVMFTMVIISQAIKRQNSIYNSLAISAFVLLCFDPYLILDVGFQLSYAAVLGIVYLFPKLYYLLEIDNWLLDKAWAITCVSFAAQIATVPMSLFYFHQFPTYFLLANLAVIPISTAVLYLGLLTLVVAWIPYVSVAVAFLLKWIVWLLNQSVFLTEAIPGALIQGFSISLIEVICLYAIIVAVLLFFHFKKLYYWTAVLVISCLLAILNITEINRHYKQKQLVIYAINNHAAISLIDGNSQLFLADSAFLENEALINFHLKNYWWEKGIKETRFLNLFQLQDKIIPVRQLGTESLIIWQDKTFLFLHQPLPKGQEYSFPVTDYLVVQHNSLRKLDNLKNKVKYIIIDGTNRKYLANQLKQQALVLNIPCHTMHQDGAFILSK